MSSYWTKRRKLNAEVDRYMGLINQTALSDSDDDASISFANVELNGVNKLSSLSNSSNEETDKMNNSEMPHYFSDEHCNSEEGSQFFYSDSSFSTDDEPNECTELQNDLAKWAVENKVSHLVVSSLLGILRKRFSYLPKDPRTLLGTDTNIVSRPIAGDVYSHLGIVDGLTRFLSRSAILSCSSIDLQINIDGLPLFKSSSSQFWSILGMVSNFSDFGFARGSPYVIGIFHGCSKPMNLTEYLDEFVKESKNLQEEGFLFNDIKYIFRLSAFVCDMPARAFIKSVTGHGGYGGCDRCSQKGVHINCVTFPEVDAPLRTDDSFTSMDDNNHHNKKQLSPLTDLSIDMVYDFTVDYMHLVCLGDTRKLISLWLNGPLATRIGRLAVDEINQKLVKLRMHFPVDFQRKPRKLSEFERWKATELRQFLLYTGPVVLVDSLTVELYKNFLLLSVGVGISLNPGLHHDYYNQSNEILVAFVRHFGNLFGVEKISYNVHALIHLNMDFQRYGVLDNVSSFPFESFLGKIKRLLRKPNSPIEQLLRRLSEQQPLTVIASNDNRGLVLKQQHDEGPIGPKMK